MAKIEIDGSLFEGGGQIFRLSLALSVLTKKPVKIENIRVKRPKPGLRPQHYAYAKILEQMTKAETEGIKKDSLSVFFNPKKVIEGSYSINIGTAGSVTLLLQGLSLIGLMREIKIMVVGGTDVPKAPSANYFKYVYLTTLEKMGIKEELDIKRRGYFPFGGGNVVFSSKPARRIKRIILEDRGYLDHLGLFVHSNGIPKKACGEIKALINSKLKDDGLKVVLKDCWMNEQEKEKRGMGVDLIGFYEKANVGVFSVWKRRKSNESMVNEVYEKIKPYLDDEKTIDIHLLDQILPFLVLAKGKSYVVAKDLTNHFLATKYVLEKFFPDCRIDVLDEEEKKKIVVEGINFLETSGSME